MFREDTYFKDEGMKIFFPFRKDDEEFLTWKGVKATQQLNPKLLGWKIHEISPH